MKTLIIFIQVLAISLDCLCTEAANTKNKMHTDLTQGSEQAFTCYKNAFNIAALGGGGQLQVELKKFWNNQDDPSRHTVTAAKQKACLTQLTSIRKPLLYIINHDKTFSNTKLCKASGMNFLRKLDSITIHYKTLLNNPSVTVRSMNMATLATLAKPQAKTLLLKNGKRGVTPVVMRNYKILDTFRYMTGNLQRNC